MPASQTAVSRFFLTRTRPSSPPGTGHAPLRLAGDRPSHPGVPGQRPPVGEPRPARTALERVLPFPARERQVEGRPRGRVLRHAQCGISRLLREGHGQGAEPEGGAHRREQGVPRRPDEHAGKDHAPFGKSRPYVPRIRSGRMLTPLKNSFVPARCWTGSA